MLDYYQFKQQYIFTTTLFLAPHHRLRADAHYPCRVAYAAAIERQVHDFRPYARFMHFVVVA